MDDILKYFFFFLFVLQAAHAESTCCDVLDEKARDFIREQSKESTEVLKSEMEHFFEKLEESFNQKLLLSHLKILSEIEKLTKIVGVNQDNLNHMDNLISSLPVLLSENRKSVESKIQSEVASLSEKVHVNDKDFSRCFSNFSRPNNQVVITAETPVSSTVDSRVEIINSTHQPTLEIRTRVTVEEVNMNSGMIEFDGGANSDVLHKVWMLQHDDRNFISDAGFVMEENQLGQNAHLTIWSDHGHHHLYNGSQGNLRTEREARGYLILVTLTMRSSPSADDHPKFKLRFTVTRRESIFTSYSSEVVRADGGVATLTYPKNAQNYPPWSLFHVVVAPSNERQFTLTLKYLDIRGNPPNCDGYLYVWLLKGNPTDTQYEKQPSSAVRECGQPGNISELVGNATVAIVQFYSGGSRKTGRGFRVEVAISEAAE